MDNIIQTPIIDEIEQSFLDYSLSVITDRAIPAAEDGFKPVQRRILWGMMEGGYKSDKPTVKCARPVGDVMGNYHPHGDSSIYGSLINMSQPWAMRYPLIDFQGNNGSRDGDGPAAMRYTECRLSKLAEATLENIKNDAVDWVDNFDETLKEPVYLPGRFPNLICNGTTGIAVAMACNFAPHNLKEVMDAAIWIEKENPSKISVDDVMQYIHGPDFPTGGLVVNQSELKSAYATGKGRVRIRGEYVIENKSGHDVIVFTSIPYKVSKEKLSEEIDALCEEGKLTGITEIRDETNKRGVRFVVECAKGISGDVVAKRLYALTDLETVFSINQVALVNKKPQQLSLIQMLNVYVKHQEEVFTRKTTHELNDVKHRIEILEGLLKACEDIDNVVALIRKSENKADARANLIKKYSLTTAQADAILDMKLSRLAHMEKIALENELVERKERALYLQKILDNPDFGRQELAKELETFRDKFKDSRRTVLTQVNTDPEEKEIEGIQPEECVVCVSESGNVKRIPSASFRAQKRNGKGVKTQDDINIMTLRTNTIDALLVFSSYGKVYRLPVMDIPIGNNTARGVNIATLVPMEQGEKFVTVASVDHGDKTSYVWFLTAKGLIKKTAITEYLNLKRKVGIIATNVREGDKIVKVFITDNHPLLIVTKNGKAIRFGGEEVAPSSRTSAGVKAMSLVEGDECATMIPLTKSQVMIFARNGGAKRLEAADFVSQHRGGKGVICAKDEEIVDVLGVEKDNNVLITGSAQAICIAVEDVPMGSKLNTMVRVIKGSDIVTTARV